MKNNKIIYIAFFTIFMFLINLNFLSAASADYSDLTTCQNACAVACTERTARGDIIGYRCSQLNENDYPTAIKFKYENQITDKTSYSISLNAGTNVRIEIIPYYDTDATNKTLTGTCTSDNSNYAKVNLNLSAKTITINGTGKTNNGSAVTVTCKFNSADGTINKSIYVNVKAKSESNDLSVCSECTKCVVNGSNVELGQIKIQNNGTSNGYAICKEVTVDNLFYNGKKVQQGKYICGIQRYLVFGCSDEYANDGTDGSGVYDDNGEAPDFDFSLGGEKSCEEIIGSNGILLVKVFIVAIRILTPILLIVLTAVEFMKAIPSQDADAVVKAWKTFGTRAIITTIIMLLPTLLNLLSKLFNIFDSCSIW